MFQEPPAKSNRQGCHLFDDAVAKRLGTLLHGQLVRTSTRGDSHSARPSKVQSNSILLEWLI